MKPAILLFVFVLGSASFLHAQIEKGSVQAGGGIGFSQQSYNNPAIGVKEKITGINVSPSIGVFYKTNKMYGAFVNFGYNEDTYNSPQINRNYGGGIFFRQYQPVAKRLYVLYDESVVYNYNSANQNGVLSHNHGINADVQAGMAYDVKKKIQLEVLLNNLLYGGYSTGTYGHSYSIGTSLQNFTLSYVSFGFRFYLK